MVKSDLGPADQTSRECAHFCELALGSITEEPMQNGSHMFEVGITCSLAVGLLDYLHT